MWVRVPPPSLPRKGLLWLCERLKGNMRRELRNEKYPFNCTDFASPNLRIYNHSPHEASLWGVCFQQDSTIAHLHLPSIARGGTCRQERQPDRIVFIVCRRAGMSFENPRPVQAAWAR